MTIQGAGMALVGPTGTHRTFVSIGARGTETRMEVKNEDGRERTVVP
jgi:hypothetical protein